MSCPEVSGVGSHVETYEGVDVAIQTTVPAPLPQRKLIPALPLTPEAFAPFGHVIQAYSNPHSAPRGVRITPANQGSAMKFHKLAPVESSYPPKLGAGTAFSVYRCKPLEDNPFGEDGWEVRRLERHRYTNQAFVPMGGGRGPSESEDALPGNGRAYLVVVAGNNLDGSPNLESLRAFVVGTGQGVVYNTGVWRMCYIQQIGSTADELLPDHPMVALETVNISTAYSLYIPFQELIYWSSRLLTLPALRRK